jgi:hypothetical protein
MKLEIGVYSVQRLGFWDICLKKYPSLSMHFFNEIFSTFFDASIFLFRKLITHKSGAEISARVFTAANACVCPLSVRLFSVRDLSKTNNNRGKNGEIIC